MKIDKFLKNVNCLYVEDEENIREVFSLMLKRYFKEVFVAKNGEEGLKLYKQKNPDLIISDIRMPVMDGIEMAKKIKETNPNAYIIFVTAFSDLEYLKAALDIGVEGYITKPVEKEKLIKKLNFFAEIFKIKKEKQNLYETLKTLFENQPEAIAFYQNEELLLSNKKFNSLFNFKTLKELFKNLEIDLNKNEQIINFKNKTYKLKLIKQNDQNYLVYLYDITPYEEQIQTDNLTGAYNRNVLNRLYSDIANKKNCVIFTDIDNFKKINDTYGHQTGDVVLKEFVKTIKNYLRKEDMIIRIGGEEFLIFVKNVTSIETVFNIAESLRRKIESLKIDNKIKITSSFGVCCKTINSLEDFENLIKKADEALYKAKKSGRNLVKACK